MGLRDRLKERIRNSHLRGKTAGVDVGAAAEKARSGASRARSGAARARKRAREIQAHLEAVDAGQPPGTDEDARSQAERAEQTATMGAPVAARLEPVDLPHPYEDRTDSEGRRHLEEFVTGGRRREDGRGRRDTADDAPGPRLDEMAQFGGQADRDDEDGGLLNWEDG